MEPISNEEIEYASRILFEGDGTMFYDNVDESSGERIEVIKCMKSKSIVACPGSGKTTALIAKLIILANRMPFEDGRGICVLTHTNVAIDLIKEKLGVGASKLFNYPNFFGTIQSFVDKYLTIPFYANSMGSRPIIDVFKYNEKVSIEYQKCNYLPKGWIDPRGGADFMQGLCFNIENPRIITKRLFTDAFAPVDKDHYKRIKKFKDQIFRYGYLSFNDAYSIANFYISKYEKLIKDAIQERFKFVFIDEMQDTANHQSLIIEKLFAGSEKTIFQKYGDPNQAIYDYEGQTGEWSPSFEDSLIISESKRFGNLIASVINPLRIQPEKWLIKGQNINSEIKPHLIIYNNENELPKIFREFSNLIKKNKLNDLPNAKFVAIGRVGKEKENGKITLKSFYPNFEKESLRRKEYFQTFIEYLGRDLLQSNSSFASNVLNGILHLLEIQNFRNEISTSKGTFTRRFSKITFFNFLKSNNEELYFEFKEKIALWSRRIKQEPINYNEKVCDEIVDFVNDKILVLKNISLKKDHSFLQHPEKIKEINKRTEQKHPEDEKHQGNICKCQLEGGHIIDIKINTIHGEKGETHTATLYLETFYKKYDSERMLDQLLGIPFKSLKKSDMVMAEKLAYVAMSRPQYLLCFAIREESIKPILDDPTKLKKLESLWKILNI